MEELSEVMIYAAIVALHKQLRSVAEIRLMPSDFVWHEEHQEEAIQLAYENGDVVLRHFQSRSDA
jgi:hypothetical protein